MASVNWGIDALIFGNLIIFASGVLASSPSSVKASETFWSSVKKSGKTANILAANEISLVSIEISEDLVNAFTIGKNERVAKAGASSVFV